MAIASLLKAVSINLTTWAQTDTNALPVPYSCFINSKIIRVSVGLGIILSTSVIMCLDA
jgi:hypothetical protein